MEKKSKREEKKEGGRKGRQRVELGEQGKKVGGEKEILEKSRLEGEKGSKR